MGYGSEIGPITSRALSELGSLGDASPVDDGFYVFAVINSCKTKQLTNKYEKKY